MDEGSRRNAAAVGRATKTRDAKGPARDSRSAAQRASRAASKVSAAWSSEAALGAGRRAETVEECGTKVGSASDGGQGIRP